MKRAKRDNIEDDDQLRDLVTSTSRKVTVKPERGDDHVRDLLDDHRKTKAATRGSIEREAD